MSILTEISKDFWWNILYQRGGNTGLITCGNNTGRNIKIKNSVSEVMHQTLMWVVEVEVVDSG
jgi:hypothetical protein